MLNFFKCMSDLADSNAANPVASSSTSSATPNDKIENSEY